MSAEQLLPLAVPAIFVVVILAQIAQLIVRRLHPLRVLTSALSLASLLLISSLALSLVGIVGIVWWLLLAASAAAVVIALVRAGRPAPGGDDARSGHRSASTPGPTGSDRRAERARRRRAKLASAPSWAGIAIEAIVLLGLLALALWAG